MSCGCDSQQQLSNYVKIHVIDVSSAPPLSDEALMSCSKHLASAATMQQSMRDAGEARSMRIGQQ
eukprot:6208954-Pleurochrysis_carterae.AAC.2